MSRAVVMFGFTTFGHRRPIVGGVTQMRGVMGFVFFTLSVLECTLMIQLGEDLHP